MKTWFRGAKVDMNMEEATNPGFWVLWRGTSVQLTMAWSGLTLDISPVAVGALIITRTDAFPKSKTSPTLFFQPVLSFFSASQFLSSPLTPKDWIPPKLRWWLKSGWTF